VAKRHSGGTSEAVAVLLNEGEDVIGLASQSGYRCFLTVPEFKRYVETEVLAQEAAREGTEEPICSIYRCANFGRFASLLAWTCEKVFCR
jgi:hypothetical protein